MTFVNFNVNSRVLYWMMILGMLNLW